MVSIPGKTVSQQFAFSCLFQIHKISKNATRGKCKRWTLSISVSTGLQFDHCLPCMPSHHLCSLPGGLRARPEAQRTPRKDAGAITQNHKENNKKAWAPTPTARARLESQENKCPRLSGHQNCHKEHSDTKQEDNGNRARHSLKNKRRWGKNNKESQPFT